VVWLLEYVHSPIAGLIHQAVPWFFSHDKPGTFARAGGFGQSVTETVDGGGVVRRGEDEASVGESSNSPAWAATIGGEHPRRGSLDQIRKRKRRALLPMQLRVVDLFF